MTPVDLYKKLPKKNCGDCRQKTCMPFALAVIKGEARLAECPHLSQEEVTALQSSFTASDWREELIAKLRAEIRNIRLSDIAADLGAELRDGTLFIRCLGREFSITSDGEIATRGHITPWIKILLLHYIRTAGKGALTGKWVSYSELKSGMVKATSFKRECEDPLKELFEKDAGKVAAALARLGAERREDFPTKQAWHLFLLPRISVVILYWPGEDEFNAEVKILFDAVADRYLDAESLIFLLEGLVKNIEMQF